MHIYGFKGEVTDDCNILWYALKRKKRWTDKRIEGWKDIAKTNLAEC